MRDIDGDGFDEIAVGTGIAGLVFVFRGSAAGVEGAGIPAQAEFQLVVESGADADFGQALARLPDTDGDGLADAIVGAPAFGTGGAAYVFEGGSPDARSPLEHCQRAIERLAV